MFEYGFANYQNVQILKKDQIVTTVSIKDGKEKINLLAAEDFSVMLSQAEKDKVKTEIKTDTAGKESVKKGDVLGKMLVYVDGKKASQKDTPGKRKDHLGYPELRGHRRLS
jgi:D-alanyl-D-alanine carboxypeptidase (penicillin-binding protein 5/6)